MSDGVSHPILERREETHRRIEEQHNSRLLLFCEDCGDMTRYTSDSLTWHCSECGGGDRTTEDVQKELRRGL